MNFDDRHEWFWPLRLKAEVEGCYKLLCPISDHAESDETISFTLKRLVFKLISDFGVSLWALILWCSEIFLFLKNV